MKNILKKLTALTLSVMLMVSLTACSSMDYSRFIELDIASSYKNEHSDELSNYFDDMSIEDLEAYYWDNMMFQTEYFLEDYCAVDLSLLPEEDFVRAGNVIAEIFSHINYEVGEYTELEDSYLIKTTIYPVDILYTTITLDFLMEAIDEVYTEYDEYGNLVITAETESAYTNLILDALEANMPTLGYLEPVELNVEITIEEDGLFYVTDESLGEIDASLVHYENIFGY